MCNVAARGWRSTRPGRHNMATAALALSVAAPSTLARASKHRESTHTDGLRAAGIPAARPRHGSKICLDARKDCGAHPVDEGPVDHRMVGARRPMVRVGMESDDIQRRARRLKGVREAGGDDEAHAGMQRNALYG
eukprot:4719244-Prymnesium_polylepis.2